MISVKQGRGPSLMGGCIGIFFAIAAAGIAITAASQGAPAIFVFVAGGMAVFGLIGAIYSFYSGVARNRPSTMDLTTGDEEPDPIATALGYGPKENDKPASPPAAAPRRRLPGDFCPFCGEKVEGEVDYCPHCGKDI